MCGIAGKLCGTGAIDPLLLARMSAVMEHRGPDSRGMFIDDGVGLAVQRLAVIDPQHGDQPAYNEDRSVVVVLNGEIYNYLELREDLLRRGHRFTSRSDTEVLVHLYEEHGDDCVTLLRGMFAFAIWDRARRQLLLARDRVGVKPLLYAQIGDCFWFASEPKAIFQDEAVPRQPDPYALDSYLHFQYVPQPRSAFAALAKLPPAHILTYTRGNMRIRRYWKLSHRPRLAALRDSELHERIRADLLEATRLRMRSDVPVGALLSGGVDSSSVVAAMARVSGERLKTFSIGFDAPEHDETGWARQVVELFDTEHHELRLDADALAVMPSLVWHYGEPFADSSAIACFFLSALARQHVTVALGGDGGDESFAGYDRYLTVQSHEGNMDDEELIRFYSRLLSWSYFDADRRTDLYAPEYRAALEDPAPLPVIAQPYASSDAADRLSRILDVDIQTYLPEDLLVKIDIASMAHSLEVRSPLLDHVLMETAAAVPSERKLAGARTKKMFKDALRDWLPDSLLNRPKMGFAVPLDDWLRRDHAELPGDVLLDPHSLGRGMFDKRAVGAMVEQHRTGAADHSSRLWALMQLELWLRAYVDPVRLAAPRVLI